MPTRAPADLFLLDTDRVAAAEDRLPTTAPGAALSRTDVAARLSAGANDRFHDLVLAGWQEAAVALLAADGVAGRKRITWLVRPGDARPAVERLLREDAAGLEVRLVVVEDRGILTVALERIGLGWSLAVLDDELVPPSELTLIGINRFNRRRSGIERVSRDVAGMLARVHRLPETVDLRALKGLHAGCGALCLAAGPSLREHLPRVRELARSCVVIAVDVLQKRLQEEGIPLDYVVTVDSHGQVVSRMGPAADSRTMLVLPVNGDQRLDAMFPLRTHFPAGGSLGGHLCGGENFPTGTIVGTASVGLAYWMGCREIALFGHDLAYGEAMYTDLVADGGGLDAFNRAQIDRLRPVPGNGDAPVMTDYWFEVAIDDFRLMIAALAEARIRNANIAGRVGAVIPGSLPLAADWAPPVPFERDAHRPQDLRRLQPPVADREACCELLRAHHREFMRLWEARVLPAEQAAEIIPFVADCRFADLMVGHCAMPGVIAATRQLAMPPSLSMAGTLAEVRAFIDACVKQSADLLERLLAVDGVLEPMADWSGFAQPQAAKELRSLVAASLELPVRPDVATLLAIEGSYLNDLRVYTRCPTPPLPRSASEGLVLLRNLMPVLDDAFLAGVLALCRLEGVEEPLTWARERGVLPEGWHPDDAEAAADAPALVRACAVLRRLAVVGPMALGREALEVVAGLPQAQVHLVRALVQDGPFAVDRVTALRRLIDGDRLELDDQLAAMILLHQAGDGAYRLLKQAAPAYGEASILAMAERLAEREPERVLRYAGDFRPLSRFHDQMEAVAVRTLLAHGRAGEALERCACLWDGGLAQRLRCEALIALGRLVEARALLLVCADGDGIDGLAARLLQSALASRDTAVIALCCRAVRALAVRFPALASVAQPASVILARLPAGQPPAAVPHPLSADPACCPLALDGVRQFIGLHWNDGIPVSQGQPLRSTGILDEAAVDAVVAEACRLLRILPPVEPPAFDTAEELVAALSAPA